MLGGEQADRERRPRRRRRGRRKKARAVVGQGGGGEGAGEEGGAAAVAGEAGRVTVESLPDVVLMRVVEALGSPPVTRPGYGSDHMRGAGFLSDLTSMAQVCSRWSRVVRSSGVWAAVCEWRWPWLASEGGGEVGALLLADSCRGHGGGTREQGLVVASSSSCGSRWSSSWGWMGLCMRVGRCLGAGGLGRRARWDYEWIQDYLMMVEVWELDGCSRLLSEVGDLCLDCWNEDEEQRYWSLSCYGAHKRSMAWPVRELLGLNLPDDLVEALSLHQYLRVEVMLMERSTGKMAMLYSGSPEDFEADGDVAVESRLGRNLVLVEREICFCFKARLERSDEEEDRVEFRLDMTAPSRADTSDVLRLVKSLEWV